MLGSSQAASAQAAARATQGKAEPAKPETVVVIGQAPLDAGVDQGRIPGRAVALDQRELTRTGTANILGALEASIGGVSLDQAQGNPFQPNLLYRGFEASPLAGDAQGLAIYLDGSRFNQPFGDTVDWDLVPDIAVNRVDLVASNPAFGLNALGGAINMQLKNGFGPAGSAIEASGGSSGRRRAALESSQRVGAFGLYVAASALDEDGWRDFSPSRLRQGYADLGWRGEGSELHLGFLGADNSLTGNGVAPVELLALDRAAVFTHPDVTDNNFQRLSIGGDFTLDASWTLRVRGYRGWLTRRTLNGDAAEVGPCSSDDDVLCVAGEDVRLVDAAGRAVPNFITHSPYTAEFPQYTEGGPYAYLNHGNTRTLSWGASSQATRSAALFGLPQRLAIGASIDQASTRFVAGTTIGGLSLDRGWFGPGIEIDQPDGDITPVGLRVTTNYLGLFASDAIDLSPHLTLTLTGRANLAKVKLRDQIGDDLNGDHTFRRFNPAAGLSWQAAGGVSVYAGYSENSRAPTPAELSCADPDAPCSLTNFFVADPPLKQVIARTIETGLRFHRQLQQGVVIDGHVDLYRTEVTDDIQIVASDIVGRGYFVNVGKTRRQGAEAGVSIRAERWEAYADYAWTDATYRTAFNLNAGGNPAFGDEADLMAVVSGDHRPGIPAHTLKLGVEYEATSTLSLGADAIVSSGRYLTGDEANLNPKTDGYAVVNLHAAQKLGSRLDLFVQIANLFDADYETFGAFSPVGEVPVAGSPGIGNSRSLSPGAPRAAYVGMRLRF